MELVSKADFWEGGKPEGWLGKWKIMPMRLRIEGSERMMRIEKNQEREEGRGGEEVGEAAAPPIVLVFLDMIGGKQI